MSQKKIKGVQLNFTIKEIRQLEVIISNVIFIKGGFNKISKFEKDFWHTLKDICNDDVEEYKKKFERTGVLKELRARKEYTKKSIVRRQQVIKAEYVEKLKAAE